MSKSDKRNANHRLRRKVKYAIRDYERIQELEEKVYASARGGGKNNGVAGNAKLLKLK